ncbi:hypothetical protein [Streptomyces sp. NPDC002676]
MNRRWWRWVLASWVLTVAVGGGLTLWLQDSARPRGPYVWENGGATPPAAPGAGEPYGQYAPPEGDESRACPPGPTPPTAALCAYATTAP